MVMMMVVVVVGLVQCLMCPRPTPSSVNPRGLFYFMTSPPIFCFADRCNIIYNNERLLRLIIELSNSVSLGT